MKTGSLRARVILTTLALLPMLFAVLIGGPVRSASLDPDDPESPHFDSEVRPA